jgi:hypothetical protein
MEDVAAPRTKFETASGARLRLLRSQPFQLDESIAKYIYWGPFLGIIVVVADLARSA